ncbi:MAG: putative signal transducing protein [Gemmata sp.]
MAGRLVTIAAFAEATVANAARNALDAAGIPATLNTEGSFGLFGRTVTALSVRLVVREADEPAAVKVLDDTFGPQEQVSEAELAARAEAAEPEDARDAAWRHRSPTPRRTRSPGRRTRASRFRRPPSASSFRSRRSSLSWPSCRPPADLAN